LKSKGLHFQRLNLNRNLNVNANNENLANSNDNGRIACCEHSQEIFMKTYKNLFPYLCSMGNLTLAWRSARNGKGSTLPAIEFEENLEKNLLALHHELKSKTYKHLPLTTFVLRDPKTRVISKSHFRDRVVHHALIRVIGKIFEKSFIYDSCANQKDKGTLFALKRFETFRRKVTCNYTRGAFCFKADIKHYFQEVDHEVLLNMIKRRISDQETIWLTEQILDADYANSKTKKERLTSEKGMPLVWMHQQTNDGVKGMPLGNLTSQFFANIYLNELDYFAKYKLKIKFYIRYVDDFVIIHHSEKQLEIWKEQIDGFLHTNLKLELHGQKSRVIPLARGIDFVGFRNFNRHKILRKRNIRGIYSKINSYRQGKKSFEDIFEVFKGWQAYARWAETYKLRNKLKQEIINNLLIKI
jgi:RNA-directed DNA polymerase